MASLRRRRVISALIDLALVNTVCGLIKLVCFAPPFFNMENAMESALKYNGHYYPHPALLVAYLVLTLLKDIIRSPGKRIMKLKLTDSRGSVPVWKRMLRNLTVVIWPVEAVTLLVSGRRITDWILGLNVVDAEEE